jgi:2-polyprenyl-6-methoxyphenol hydroxylase-like FAD-dependent oxidoreductase
VTLDAILVAAAERAGVEVRTGTNMTGLIRDGARVTGVETNHGPIRAALVVGADGQHSRVAATGGAREYAVTPAGRLFTWGYFRGVPRTTQIKLGRVGPHGYLAAPTDGGLYMAGVAPDIDRKADFHGDREAQFEAGLRAWPELWDVLAGAERDGPIRMVSAWHGFFRPAAGPGWVLLGDAGQFKDPTPGQGISDALRHAERLADVVAPLIGDPAGLDVALLRWWRWRDRDSREMHWLATDLGAPGPLPPLREWMIADLAATAEGRLAFMRMFNHEIPASEIFGPARLARAVAAVRRRGDVPLGAIAREAYGLVADGVRQVPASRPPKQWRLRRNPRRAGAPHASGSARDAAFASRS